MLRERERERERGGGEGGGRGRERGPGLTLDSVDSIICHTKLTIEKYRNFRERKVPETDK